MENNLTVDTYNNGDKIPNVTDPKEWNALSTGAWCWYDNDSATYAKYGKLYNWYAVKDSRGLAPKGWHIPSDAEWIALTNCNQGKYLGVSGLGGYRDINGVCQRIKSLGFWWSFTEDDLGIPLIYSMNISLNKTRSNGDKRNGFYVLCIKNVN
jgi:hypothetical protein